MDTQQINSGRGDLPNSAEDKTSKFYVLPIDDESPTWLQYVKFCRELVKTIEIECEDTPFAFALSKTVVICC